MDRSNQRQHPLGMMRRTLGALVDGAARALGQLGKRLGYPALASVPVSAVMLSRLDAVTPEQSLEDVAQLLVTGRHAQLPVLEDGFPVGVVTRDDVALGLERSGPHSPVGEAPRHDVVTVTPSDSLADVLERLRATPETVAVVVDHGTTVGLLTVDKLVAYVERARTT
jgi:CBS domain-containing protein